MEAQSWLWYEKGKLAKETSYLNGNQHGYEREWLSDGMLIRETNYKNGRKDGIEKIWDRDGNKKINVYKNNELIETKSDDE